MSFIAKLIRLSGIVMLILGGVFIRMAVKAPKEYPLSFVFYGACLAGTGIFLWRRARRWMKAIAAKEMSIDMRAPILYLRAFEDERKSGKPLLHWILIVLGLIVSPVPQDLKTEEEHLAGIFKYAGPFICIGRPREKLPPLGALRFYFGDDWREQILALCNRAKLIVLRGHALNDEKKQEGFRYELEMVWREIDPRKLVYILPVRQKDVDSFLSLLSGITKKEMPLVQVSGSADRFSGILFINEHGEFQFQEMKKQYYRFGNVLSIKLKKTFAAAGIDLDNGLFEKPLLVKQWYAFLIDFMIVFGCSILFYGIHFIWNGKAYSLSVILWLMPLVYIFYCGIMDFTPSAATFGKRYYKIVVLDKERIKMNIQQVLSRCAMRMFSVFLFPLDFLLMYLYGAHVHDIIAGTREFQRMQ
ncbi:RDD family protein [Chitinophaga silvisoli]|uniref:RDD domain-containing protein n=1 Tax=Chitinophaga silvisoli TaxID=2291814 RepID=A0A3E1NUP1_9BACT|nr:RDD family protein [Chitinophaga silvisoli]RFM31640.1 hypothetical protein DXN04_28430 [Chitinophaga silvisoli]